MDVNFSFVDVLSLYDILHQEIVVLNRVQGINENLHDTISFLITNLTGYLKFYKNSYTVLYPVYFLLGLLFSVMERGTDNFVEFLSKPARLFISCLWQDYFSSSAPGLPAGFSRNCTAITWKNSKTS